MGVEVETSPWEEGALRIAFASSDNKRVDQHFGTAKGLVIYSVDPEQSRVVEVMEFATQAMDGNEDKLESKIAALEGCAAVYSQAIGASAIRQLQRQGIQPVKVAPGSTIQQLISDLQQELVSGPNSWMARAISRESGVSPARFDAMEAEGWEE
ncbi:MAG: nitrogen fixation protein NifX [Gammaproteobacteria bacterium]|nr:nitrogen fixation protein NifX [Gammaproteobacteria bacterium]